MKVPLSALDGFVRDVLGRLPHGKQAAVLVALRGDLGAGKTTFTQMLARELGVAGPVQSPTYVLMKSYPIAYKQFTSLVHIDAYRLESPAQFMHLDPGRFLDDPHALVVVEWPERLGDALPKPDLMVMFSADGASSGERYIEVI